jgi:hypothetical protein
MFESHAINRLNQPQHLGGSGVVIM